MKNEEPGKPWPVPSFPEAGGWPDAAGPSTVERFSERTLRGIAALARDIIFSQEYATRNGFLQRLDSRAKLVTILALIVAISLCRGAGILAAFYAATLILAAVSGIPLLFFIKRVWFFIPLFSGIIALPALFLVPGKALFCIGHVGGWDISITQQGAEAMLIFVLRVAASVSFIALLTITTKWTSLLSALRAVFVPAFFIMIIGITYRYIFHLLAFVEELHFARKSRTMSAGDARGGRRWVAGRMGYTLSRSLRMGDEVYEAMVSRGFSGDVRLMDKSRPGGRDILWIAIVILGILAAYFLGGFN